MSSSGQILRSKALRTAVVDDAFFGVTGNSLTHCPNTVPANLAVVYRGPSITYSDANKTIGVDAAVTVGGVTPSLTQCIQALLGGTFFVPATAGRIITLPAATAIANAFYSLNKTILVSGDFFEFRIVSTGASTVIAAAGANTTPSGVALTAASSQNHRIIVVSATYDATSLCTGASFLLCSMSNVL